ncbi:MAG: FAD-dependent oxidoreductase [Candidatus Brocadiia bacterium]
MTADIVIDATGDADMAALAGCEYDRGHDENGAMTPVTLELHVDNVAQDTDASYPPVKTFVRHVMFAESGEISKAPLINGFSCGVSQALDLPGYIRFFQRRTLY